VLFMSQPVLVYVSGNFEFKVKQLHAVQLHSVQCTVAEGIARSELDGTR